MRKRAEMALEGTSKEMVLFVCLYYHHAYFWVTNGPVYTETGVSKTVQ